MSSEVYTYLVTVWWEFEEANSVSQSRNVPLHMGGDLSQSASRSNKGYASETLCCVYSQGGKVCVFHTTL